MQHALKDRDFRSQMSSQPNEVSLFAANASVVWNLWILLRPFRSDDPFVFFFVHTGLEADTKILDATLVIRPLCLLQACNPEQGPISVECLMETHTSQLVVWMLAPVSVTLQVPWDRHCFYVSREIYDCQCAGSILTFVFSHETASGTACFGVCAQEHTVIIVVEIQSRFKGGCLQPVVRAMLIVFRRHLDCFPFTCNQTFQGTCKA